MLREVERLTTATRSGPASLPTPPLSAFPAPARPPCAAAAGSAPNRTATAAAPRPRAGLRSARPRHAGLHARVGLVLAGAASVVALVLALGAARSSAGEHARVPAPAEADLQAGNGHEHPSKADRGREASALRAVAPRARPQTPPPAASGSAALRTQLIALPAQSRRLACEAHAPRARRPSASGRPLARSNCSDPDADGPSA